MDKIARLKEILESSRRAVFFGGAGMSTESGIPDFRSAGGIYSETLHREFSPEQMASHSFLMAHPAEFFDIYRRHCPNHADPPPHTAIETQSEVHPCPSKRFSQ
nr:Sir2 family NAD-dependent protein deacetylase [uncultured Selenomonas sp.]